MVLAWIMRIVLAVAVSIVVFLSVVALGDWLAFDLKITAGFLGGYVFHALRYA